MTPLPIPLDPQPRRRDLRRVNEALGWVAIAVMALLTVAVFIKRGCQ